MWHRRLSLEPGLAESWEVSDTQDVHLQGARGPVPHALPSPPRMRHFASTVRRRKRGHRAVHHLGGDSTEAPDPRTCVIRLKTSGTLRGGLGDVVPSSPGRSMRSRETCSSSIQSHRTVPVRLAYARRRSRAGEEPELLQSGIPYLTGYVQVLKTPTRASSSCRAVSPISRHSFRITSWKSSVTTQRSSPTQRPSLASILPRSTRRARRLMTRSCVRG